MHRWCPPPAALLFGIAAMWFIKQLPPEWAAWSLAFEFPGRRVVGLVLFAVAAVWLVAAAAAMQRARTTVNPLTPERASALVTSGPFAWSRNPIYLGDAVILAGATFWFGTGWGVVLAGAFVLYVDRVQIRVEERALRSRFGDAFQAYAARVHRWFGRAGAA